MFCCIVYVMYALQCMISLMLYSVFQIKNRIVRIDIKVGFKEVYIARTCFPDDTCLFPVWCVFEPGPMYVTRWWSPVQ